MKISRQVLGKIGKCIYCGKIDKSLRKEHIVPYGLNGPWELLEASCDKCAKITSLFEKDVLKKSLIVPRVALNLPTRRKKQRPKKFNFTVERNGKKEVIEVPIMEHFAVMILPITKFPAYLDGHKYEKGINIIGSIAIKVGGPPVEQILKKYDTKSLSITAPWIGNSFDRMLAKIAYGFSVAKFGIDNIEEVYVLPAILGQKEDVGNWIGTAKDTQLENTKFFHLIQVEIINGEIIVRMRLFANYKNVPEYLAVVGKISKKFLIK